MKKLISALVLGAACLTLGVNVASAESGSSSDTELTSTVRSCVAAAVATREAALSGGFADFNEMVADAYADRAAALASAWSGTKTRAQVKEEVKNAWKAFKSAVKDARGDWKSEKKSVWSTFKTSAKNCKAPSDTVDTSNASTEA
ncbi:MAG: hypothetical protein AAB440_00260 [Patescibacteria group bacterium]